MMKDPIAITGYGGLNRVVTGRVVNWSNGYLENREAVKKKIVYLMGQLHLYIAASLIDLDVLGVLMEEGGKNNHSLILLNEGGIPTVSGIGRHDLAGLTVTMNSGAGLVFEGEKDVGIHVDGGARSHVSTRSPVYVNVGHPNGITEAAKTEADGIGLLRTEFVLVGTLARNLRARYSDELSIEDLIHASNEADTIYLLAQHQDFRKHLLSDLKMTFSKAIRKFGSKEIIIRTPDIPRTSDDTMGNRGVRRCIAEGGHILRILAQAIIQTINDNEGEQTLGIILPLVSHYSQIATVLDIFIDEGLRLETEGKRSKYDIRFGWEIEQPAASLNNGLWLRAFEAEYGQTPHFIGIGTNDLTQFTMAVGRDIHTQEEDPGVREYLGDLYSEDDFSVVKQIYDVSKQVDAVGTRLFLLGEAAGSPEFLELVLAFGIIPSVGINKVREVRRLVKEFETDGDPRSVIVKYINNVSSCYPSSAGKQIQSYLLEIFDLT